MPRKKREKLEPLLVAELGQHDAPPELQTLPSGDELHLVRSGLTVVSCMYHPERLREMLAGCVLEYIEMARTGESPDYVGLGIDEGTEGARIAVQYRDPELHAELQKYADLAYDYFAGAIQRKLHELPQQLFIEVMNAVVIRMKRDGLIPLKEKSAATDIWNEYFDRLKVRIKSQWDAPGRGPEPDWTPERRAEVLDYYNAVLGELQPAYNTYKSKRHLPNWQKEVERKHPDLGGELIGRLMDTIPSDLNQNLQDWDTHAAFRFNVLARAATA
ncbi:MAG: hypothetical protein LC808_42260 [Actinobacteria bacterium]|nr:hypothetical protein [Actinomycetota bacterium]